ncbi:hypothetical protein HUS82_30335, partial [Pseudomonas protegens]|nr:hypothetical protein [Pseudomonas protegens]
SAHAPIALQRRLVDQFGARSGFWLALAGGAVVLGAALQSYRRMR